MAIANYNLDIFTFGNAVAKFTVYILNCVNNGFGYGNSFEPDGKCRLFVQSPSAGDSGHYTCVAQNATWKDEISTYVVVPGTRLSTRTGTIGIMTIFC